MSQPLRDILGNSFIKAAVSYAEKNILDDDSIMYRLGKYIDFVKRLNSTLSDDNKLLVQKIGDSILDRVILGDKLERIDIEEVEKINKFMSKIGITLSEKHKEVILGFINKTLSENSLNFQGALLFNGIEIPPVTEQKIISLVSEKLKELNTLEDVLETCKLFNRDGVSLSDEQKDFLRQIGSKLIEPLFDDIKTLFSESSGVFSKELRDSLKKAIDLVKFTCVSISDDKKKIASDCIDLCAKDTLRRIKEEPDHMSPRDILVHPKIKFICDLSDTFGFELSKN